jgi:hypothetical protein
MPMRAVPPSDLRQSQRIPATIPIRLAVESEDFKVEHEASTIDLSLRGVKVRTSFALLAGETVGIITSGDSRHTISARVVWVQRVGTDLWSLAGLEFLDTMPA